MDAESAARWSAWPAAICYVAAWAISLRHSGCRLRIWIRPLWTAGWVALVVHVIVALALVHGWSWSAAYEHTAQRTQSLVGWNWGGGVWFNLLTVGVWGADVLRMWSTSSNPDRSVPAANWSHWSNWVVQSYMAFMMINATVVFGSRFAQFTGCLMCAGLAMCAWQQHCNRRG